MAGGMRSSLKYFFGEEPDDGGLQFLLVSSSQQYLDELQKLLYVTRRIQGDKRIYNLKVHTCKNISDVLSLMSDLTVDFVVFVVDVKSCSCLLEVEENLKSLGNSFGKEKMCMVNPNPSYERAVVQPQELWAFAHQYQLNIVNGRINNPERANNLSKRVLNLAEACCGVINGKPLTGCA